MTDMLPLDRRLNKIYAFYRQLMLKMDSARIMVLSTAAYLSFAAVCNVLFFLLPKGHLSLAWAVGISIPIVIFAPTTYYLMSRFAKQTHRNEQRLSEANAALEKAIAERKKLQTLLPICAACKKIRDDQGYWIQLENYFKDRTGMDFIDSLCPACASCALPQHKENAQPEPERR